VENTGKVAGQEVVQLYLAPTQLSPALNMPVKQLRGFRKVRLAPGETKTLTLTLSADEFYAFDERRAGYFVPTGDYQVRVGGASDRLPLAGRLTLRPAKARPDLQIVNLRTVPPYPKPGDAVIFVASVVNRGTGPVPAERVARVLFSVNDKVVAGGRLAGTPLPPGGMALVSSDSGAARPSWTAREGKFEVLAEVNPDLAVDEPETNNVCRGTMVLPGGRILPQGKP
jgi:beta-glucosidase